MANEDLKPIEEVNPIEFGTPKTRTRKDGTISTTVPFYPLRDKVVIKVVFKEPMGVIKKEEDIRRAEPLYQEIVAIGDEVAGVEIGDKVQVSFNYTIQPVNFKNNPKSISAIQKQQDAGKLLLTPSTKALKKYTMIEYYVVPFASIEGIITE